MRILIYGFGRMGLTHFSILNSLNAEIEFSVIEPSKILRTILKKNINAKFYADDSTLNESFDITLITTPPSVHLQLLEKSVKRGDKKIFIEKPFGGYTNTKLNNVLESNIIILVMSFVLIPVFNGLKLILTLKILNLFTANTLVTLLRKNQQVGVMGPFQVF